MRTAVVGALEETKYLKVLSQSKNLNVLSLILMFFSFLFFYKSLPCMSFEFTNWPLNVQNDTRRRINGQIVHNTDQAHLRELHCKDSSVLKF